MQEFKVEYLILFKSAGSFCDRIDTFNKLLETTSDLIIKDKQLLFAEKMFDYEIVSNEVKDQDQRYFKIKLSSADEKLIPTFLSLLKIIREQVYRGNGAISVLWDDISTYYSIRAYPEINKIENLLRKLITTFMLTNVGLNWANETIPNEIKSSVNKKGKSAQQLNNFIHDTDFIQLADFLFKSYQTKDIQNLYKLIKDAKKSDDLDFEDLKEYLPKSNWDRYFKSHVDCEDDFLNKKWTRLSELRCLVAHNNLLSKLEYEEIIEHVSVLSEKLQGAIDSIDQIIIPVEEQAQVIESSVKAIDERLSEFLSTWKTIEKDIRDVYIKKGLGEQGKVYNIRIMIKELINTGILLPEFLEKLDPIGAFRNKLVLS